ncbi:MAG: hypothetical protein KDD55_01630 [Bdellovibrionales bacterium]|nr:hypothetical protein [Bdellovibrionales bacterium]
MSTNNAIKGHRDLIEEVTDSLLRSLVELYSEEDLCAPDAEALFSHLFDLENETVGELLKAALIIKRLGKKEDCGSKRCVLK